MKNIFMTLLLFAIPLAAQQPLSIHQQEWDAHRYLAKQPPLPGVAGMTVMPLQMRKNAFLQADVFGYLPDWQYTSARNYLQYDLLSHIGAFDFTVSSNGDIANPSYWPWNDVINAAHYEGTKVILVAVNFDATSIHNLLTVQSAKQNFFEQAKKKIEDYNLDGINIDFEGLNSADRGALLNGFMADLTTYLHQELPGTEVSFAGPAVNWGGWDLAGLANSCDYIFIMGYAFAGKWSTSTGANAPLDGGSINITDTVLDEYYAVTLNHPEKLILGVPYYGNKWQSSGNAAHSGVVSWESHPRFDDAQVESGGYGRKWDATSASPWYAWQIQNDWYQVWYDDAQSLALKYDLADSNAYRGVGMWALGYDGDRDELWNELRRRYLPESQPIPRKPNGVLAVGSADGITISIPPATFTDRMRIFFGTDGSTFADSLEVQGIAHTLNSLETDSLYYFKVKAGNDSGFGPMSAVLAAQVTTSMPVLIVDGFDRNDDLHNRFNYVIRHAQAFRELGYKVATVQNEAVAQARINLSDYKIVDWFSGDEGTVDVTFGNNEKQALRAYLEQGGRLLVSGSEIGWDLVANGSEDDKTFYRDYLKAEYIDDAPLGQKSSFYRVTPGAGWVFEGMQDFQFDDGSGGTYDIDWPDAVKASSGATLALHFDGVTESDGGCGVTYSGTFGTGNAEGRLVYLSFPFESITDSTARLQLLRRITTFFESPTDLATHAAIPRTVDLLPNYPNPFNPQTTLTYLLPRAMDIELTLFDALGRKVHALEKGFFQAGTHYYRLNGSKLSSGVYFIRLLTKEGALTRKIILNK